MLGRNRRPLDQRKQVALHAFARHIRPCPLRARSDLVDLVEEDDAIILGDAQRLALHGLIVQQLVRLFLDQRLVSFLDRRAHALLPAAKSLQQLAKVHHPDGRARLPRNVEPAHGVGGVGHVDLDFLVVQQTAPKLRAKALARRRLRRCANQRIKHAILSLGLGLGNHFLATPLAHHADGDLNQIADDLLDIAADITNLGELGGLDLQERRLGQLGQPPRNLRLAHAGGPDHQDVFRRHFLAQPLRQLLAPPPVAQRQRHGPLGLRLAHNIAVQF